MIVVKLEMWPLGFEDKKRELGRIEITNDYKTTAKDRSLGSYVVRLFKSASQGAKSPGVWRKGRVENFPRKKLGNYDLLYRALKTLVGDRNPDIETMFTEVDDGEEVR